MSSSFLIALCLGLLLAWPAAGHDIHTGACPRFTPMEGFDWARFSAGRWFATEKFDTSSKCLAYQFGEEHATSGHGNRFVVQTSVNSHLRRISVDNTYVYKGKIEAKSIANPADMIVTFPLNPLGSASFVVLDTDYDGHALLCTCQAQKLIFEIFTVHRRSCTILQRRPERDTATADRLHALLNRDIGNGDEDDKPDHDFDVISHANCDYEITDGKGLNIDVDKILGDTQTKVEDAVEDVVGGVVDTMDDLFLHNKDDSEGLVVFSVPGSDENDDDSRRNYPRI